jgi:hypothetical protein
LELVDEEGAGRVHRVHEGDPGHDRELVQCLPDALGDVREFGPLFARQNERGIENLHAILSEAKWWVAK